MDSTDSTEDLIAEAKRLRGDKKYGSYLAGSTAADLKKSFDKINDILESRGVEKLKWVTSRISRV